MYVFVIDMKTDFRSSNSSSNSNWFDIYVEGNDSENLSSRIQQGS